MKKYLPSIEFYKHRLEQSQYRPVEFLSFLKKNNVPIIKVTPFRIQDTLLTLTGEIHTKDILRLLCEVHIVETTKRQVGNECLLKLMSSPVLQRSVSLTGITTVSHISCVTPDQVWISDYLYNNLLLINTVGDTLHQLTDRCSGWGVYTVDIGGNLIYIDKEYNISKLCENNRRKVKLIKSTNEPWRPRCIYSCPSCGDLLAVMWNIDTKTINVTRYTSIGQHIQTIQQNSRGQDIYSYPKYITENNNGDIVVSDFNNGVVVTEVGGKYRFSYTGPPSKSGLDPLGICTDALSHILVCDGYTRAVHMIDKDGHFLSMLPLTKQQNIHEPWSLCYDKKSHLLWVGSLDGRVNVYRHIERKDKVPDNKNHFY
ncbi:uncharacterized protein LOC134271457 [Saccostrea cucullata]|uniref:uncharacterized protein LOC134271457 n=1 Tax=Saccostrea cuccullata TaxID=36930 RepID=UPI002ED54625